MMKKKPQMNGKTMSYQHVYQNLFEQHENATNTDFLLIIFVVITYDTSSN